MFPDMPEGHDDSATTGRQRRAVLAVAATAALLASGCCPCPPPGEIQPNRRPQIEALFATVDGQRVRVVRPNTTVTVVARVADLDGDRVDYEWELEDTGGALTDIADASVTWSVGSGDAGKLRLVVHDEGGGTDHREISASTDSLYFGGRVVTGDGTPVVGAEVEVNGDRTRTDTDGQFRLPVLDPDAPRFILSIRQAGLGLLSRVYDTTIPESEWTLRRGTTVNVDPTQAIVVQDISASANCPGPPSTQIDWSRYPRERWPQIFNSAGVRLDIPYPAELQRARDQLGDDTPCAAGLTVRFGANSFVSAAGTVPTGNVDVTVSTVDLYSPGSMPGDFTVRLADDRYGYMESFGAGDVTVRAGGESYQLRPRADASIEIPIDPLRLRMESPLDSVIPFLAYDEAAGEWVEEGSAFLSPSRNSYAAVLSHLSTFNMDLIKTDQACVRFESPLLPATYQLQVTIPQATGPPVVRTKTVSQATETTHSLYNLPKETWIELLPIVTVGGSPAPIGTFVVFTGLAQSPSTPNRPTYDYQVCNGRITLTDQVGPIVLTYNGAGHVYGPRPFHPYTLTNAAGTDIYPVGTGVLYLFGLFDTGSDIVVLSDLQVSGSPHPQSDASLLNVRHPTPPLYRPTQGTDPDLDVRIRIAGLDEIDAATLNGPINPPGSPGGADVELTGLRIGPRDINVTLMGAPVTTRVVAEMDNTTIVNRGPYPGGVTISGPDMQFYLPSSTSIPVPTVELPLARFGTTTPSGVDNATRDQRVFLRNVTFTNGSNSVSDDQSAVIPRQFLFDTGAPITIISTDVANALGISWTPSGGGTQDCWNTKPGNEGFEITSLDIVSLGPGSGTYKIAPVVVCVDIDGTAIRTVYLNPSPPPPAPFVDGVIGLNVLDHVPILVNLPDGYLGILAPPP